MAKAELPQGLVTFLFTDIEGSTKLFRTLDDDYHDVLNRYREILQRVVDRGDGVIVETQGDGCFIAFGDARNGVVAAIEAQLRFSEGLWSHGAEVRVRMGLHTGWAVPAKGDYTALAVHRAARISAAANGSQVLCTTATKSAIEGSNRELDPIVLRDLGTFSLKDFPEPEHIYQVQHRRLPASFEPIRAISPRTNNLPLRTTSFVGRDEELKELRKLLQSSRLLTVLGAGGAGKTRLAIELAGDYSTSLRDGAWLVELAGVREGIQVASVVAQELDIGVTPGRRAVEAICEILEGKELFLVVDNCEHVLDGVAEVCDAVLRRCEGVTILATSRERIGIPSEVVWRIPSMRVPESEVIELEHLVEYEAVTLFRDRAAHTFPSFELTMENGSAVGEICRQLDGVPLAIELAAARIGTLSPTEIIEGLADRFRFLNQGNRAALPRHRTLKAALDWSLDLLGASEKMLFDSLGVFAGSWSLDAARRIFSVVAPQARVEDLLERLVDCSLVVRDPAVEGRRYGMLETVRHAAATNLNESNSSVILRQAHLDFYLELARSADLEGAGQKHWLEVLRSDHENFRLALEFASQSSSTAALEMAACLAPYWRIRGDLKEGSDWIERTLAQSPDDDSFRAVALLGAGGLAVSRGDYEGATILLEQSATAFRDRGDLTGAARTGFDLAWIAWREGQNDRAEKLLKNYLAVFDLAGDRKGVAEANRMLGVIAAERYEVDLATSYLENALSGFQATGDNVGAAGALASLGITFEYKGELERACELMSESLAIAREIGDQRRIASSLDNLGFFWQQRGELSKAWNLHNESLAILRRIGDLSTTAAALTNLGSTARQLGSLLEARMALLESLSIARDTADRSRDVADVLEELAAVDISEGYDRRALSLFGAAEQIRESVGYPLRGFFKNMYDPLIATARSRA